MSLQQILGGPCPKCGMHHPNSVSCDEHQAERHSEIERLVENASKYILCVNCRATFSEDEIDGWGCPKCGNKGVPADTRKKSTVTLTNHEWQILTIWADNWARKMCAKSDQDGVDSVTCITAIINEMRRQAPSMSGLTIHEQIQEVADHFGTKAEMYSDGESETFEPKKRN